MIKIDFQYFGSIHYVKTLMENKEAIFDQDASFTKMSFKNRMVITSSQGPLLLTIPIVGGRDQKTPLKNILIAYGSHWVSQHLKSIQINYKRAPFFEYYEQSLIELYLNKPETLVHFLILCNDWLQHQLKIKWEMTNEIENNDFSLMNKIVDPWLPKNYHQNRELPRYQQVFSDKVGFIPNTCILDMLFCMGGKEINKLWAPVMK